MTWPLPLPLVELVIEIQEAESEAVHAHPLPAVTVIVPVAALELSVVLTGDSTYVQATPSCVTVTVRPATVSVPVRWLVLVLAATE